MSTELNSRGSNKDNKTRKSRARTATASQLPACFVQVLRGGSSARCRSNFESRQLLRLSRNRNWLLQFLQAQLNFCAKRCSGLHPNKRNWDQIWKKSVSQTRIWKRYCEWLAPLKQRVRIHKMYAGAKLD